MKVSLTIAHRVGVKHILDNIQGISMDGAMHARALRQSFSLNDIPDNTPLSTVLKDIEEHDYAVELGRVEWLVEVVKTAFASKTVHPLFSDLVLNVYELLSDNLRVTKEVKKDGVM